MLQLTFINYPRVNLLTLNIENNKSKNFLYVALSFLFSSRFSG